jgi:hypothetical protein
MARPPPRAKMMKYLCKSRRPIHRTGLIVTLNRAASADYSTVTTTVTNDTNAQTVITAIQQTPPSRSILISLLRQYATWHNRGWEATMMAYCQWSFLPCKLQFNKWNLWLQIDDCTDAWRALSISLATARDSSWIPKSYKLIMNHSPCDRRATGQTFSGKNFTKTLRYYGELKHC